MQFTKVFLASALAAIASAVQFTNSDFSGIVAGTPFNITWQDAQGPVTIVLKDGPSTALGTVGTIASGVTGGSTLWTPTASGTFALEITDSTNVPNYSVQFSVTGGTAIASSSTDATSTGTTTLSSTTSVSEVTTTTATTTGSVTTGVSNSTATTATTGTSKTTGTTTRPSSSATGTAPPNTNSATQRASSFALAVLALAAFAGFN